MQLDPRNKSFCMLTRWLASMHLSAMARLSARKFAGYWLIGQYSTNAARDVLPSTIQKFELCEADETAGPRYRTVCRLCDSQFVVRIGSRTSCVNVCPKSLEPYKTQSIAHSMRPV